MRRGLTVASLFCVLGLAGGASGQTVNYAPEFTIDIEPSLVRVSGVVSSDAHDEILRETAARLFADRTAEFAVHIQVALPPGWGLITDLTLQALATTRSATATVDDAGISIRGITTDEARWIAAAERIENVIPEGWTLDHQVEAVAASASINRQCIELFRTAMRGRKIEFERASSTLGTATAPILDELIQIVTDCPGATIEIKGHTDHSGAENANVALSQARADAVANYLVRGGVPKDWISANGVGSSEPLTEEDSPQSRRLNRRIEVELLFP